MILNTMVAVWLCVCGARAARAAGAGACYWSAPCPYALFGSKTPYDAVRGDFRDARPPPGCEAESVWALVRHGARHPGDGDTRAMRRVAEHLRPRILNAHAYARGHLCYQDVDDLREWEWDDRLDNTSSHLTDIGYRELMQMGHRIKTKYSHLISNDSGEFYFRPTDEQRTIASAEAFVRGLAEGAAVEVLVDEARLEDAVIRPYKMCPKYDEIRDTQPTAEHYVTEFCHTPEFRLMLQDVEERVGLGNELTPEEVIALYELCRFYRSFETHRRSPWCSIFSDDNLITLEYIDDIRHFYKNGYGSDINCRLGATALKDLYERFENVYEGRGKAFVGYFTHDTMMEMVFCAMGLYRDDFDLSGSVRTPTRKWRTSYISPFATNLVAVMHKCEASHGFAADHLIQFFINEQELEVCAWGGCSWQQFQDKFKSYAETTLEFCAISNDSSRQTEF